jgi:hypothetical protein
MDIKSLSSQNSRGTGPQRRRQPAQRSSRPCDLCRRRKTRCLIESGEVSCSVCQQRRNECTFKEEAPRRPLPGVADDLPSTPPVQASPSPNDVLNSQQFTTNTAATVANFNSSNAGPGDSIEQVQRNNPSQSAAWSGVLGLNRNKFAELYGLGSDMEPILMVCI